MDRDRGSQKLQGLVIVVLAMNTVMSFYKNGSLQADRETQLEVADSAKAQVAQLEEQLMQANTNVIDLKASLENRTMEVSGLLASLSECRRELTTVQEGFQDSLKKIHSEISHQGMTITKQGHTIAKQAREVVTVHHVMLFILLPLLALGSAFVLPVPGKTAAQVALADGSVPPLPGGQHQSAPSAQGSSGDEPRHAGDAAGQGAVQHVELPWQLEHQCAKLCAACLGLALASRCVQPWDIILRNVWVMIQGQYDSLLCLLFVVLLTHPLMGLAVRHGSRNLGGRWGEILQLLLPTLQSAWAQAVVSMGFSWASAVGRVLRQQQDHSWPLLEDSLLQYILKLCALYCFVVAFKMAGILAITGLNINVNVGQAKRDAYLESLSSRIDWFLRVPSKLCSYLVMTVAPLLSFDLSLGQWAGLWTRSEAAVPHLLVMLACQFAVECISDLLLTLLKKLDASDIRDPAGVLIAQLAQLVQGLLGAASGLGLLQALSVEGEGAQSHGVLLLPMLVTLATLLILWFWSLAIPEVLNVLNLLNIQSGAVSIRPISLSKVRISNTGMSTWSPVTIPRKTKAIITVRYNEETLGSVRLEMEKDVKVEPGDSSLCELKQEVNLLKTAVLSIDFDRFDLAMLDIEWRVSLPVLSSRLGIQGGSTTVTGQEKLGDLCDDVMGLIQREIEKNVEKVVEPMARAARAARAAIGFREVLKSKNVPGIFKEGIDRLSDQIKGHVSEAFSALQPGGGQPSDVPSPSAPPEADAEQTWTGGSPATTASSSSPHGPRTHGSSPATSPDMPPDVLKEAGDRFNGMADPVSQALSALQPGGEQPSDVPSPSTPPKADVGQTLTGGSPATTASSCSPHRPPTHGSSPATSRRKRWTERRRV